MAAKSNGKIFFEKSDPEESADTLWVKIFIEIALSRSVFEINTFLHYTKIQDGRQKWRKNDFCKKSPVHSADNLRVKNFVKIALSHSIIEINAFVCLTQKFKMAAKSGGKMILRPCVSKNSSKTLYLAPFLR